MNGFRGHDRTDIEFKSGHQHTSGGSAVEVTTSGGSAAEANISGGTGADSWTGQASGADSWTGETSGAYWTKRPQEQTRDRRGLWSAVCSPQPRNGNRQKEALRSGEKSL